MPNWKIHIEVANRIGKYLNYTNDNLNLFIYGNILPDINNGYVLAGISKIISHDITHFKDLNSYTYNVFYEKYKEEIKKENPVLLGYLIHLYTDYSFNNAFYESIKDTPFEKETHNTLRIMKQHDFKVYNNKFIKNNVDLNNIMNICIKESEKIDEVSVLEGDVNKALELLKNQELYDANLLYFTDDKLNKIMEKTIKDLKKYLSKINIRRNFE